jgi:hypothetical protein
MQHEFDMVFGQIGNLVAIAFFTAITIFVVGGGSAIIIMIPVTILSIGLALTFSHLFNMSEKRYGYVRKELDRTQSELQRAHKRIAEFEKSLKTTKRYDEVFATIKAAVTCAITHEVPTDPLVTRTGHMYSRAALYRWAASTGGRLTCPLTRANLSEYELVHNIPVLNVCDALRMLDHH